MKKFLSAVICCFVLLGLVGCEKMDPNYGKSSAKAEKASDKPQYKNIVIPEIKSDDEVMPTYIDISLYDEENYSDIYLGKNFEYKTTYNGSELNVPTNYKNMIKNGWAIVESGEYSKDSQILVGKSLKVNFEDQYGKQITAVFYNGGKSSETVEKCRIVKFIIGENVFLNPNSVYGQFWINGVGNESAITDIIEYLGAPSHFYRVSENKYYLDWFISKNDRRNGITIYIDTAEDCIDAVEIAHY